MLVLLAAVASGCQYVGTTGPRVSFHGDSMGAQGAPQITHRLTRHHRLYLDATERAVIDDKLPSIRALAQNGPRPDVAVIELGSGDANDRHGDARMRRNIRQVLDALRDVPCVAWFSLRIAGVNGFYQGYVDRADDFNRILTTEVADYPNARVAPYRQWSVEHAGAFKADGLHHTAQGKTLFAEFVEQVADNCP